MLFISSSTTVPAFLIRTALLPMLTVLLLGVSTAMGADHRFATSVALSQEYNDNIFLNADTVVSDNITTVAPKLEVERHSERYTLRADGMLEFYRYHDYDTFDDVDQWYNGSLVATPTERWQVGANARLSDDNRPDRDIETTGLVLNNIRRKRVNADTSAFYTFSEKLVGGLVLNFNRENFDDPETSDRRDYGAMLAVTRSLDGWLARTTGRLNLGYNHYEFEREYQQAGTLGFFDVTTVVEDRSEVDNLSLTIGTESALTEKINLVADLGGRYGRSTRDMRVSRTYFPSYISEAPYSIDDTSDSAGFVGNVTFGYRGERSRCDLLLSHDLQPVSGNNATANRTTIRLSGGLRLQEKLYGDLSFQWYRNESDQDDSTQDDIDTQTWNARAGLRWELTRMFSLKGDYTYTIYDDREEGNTAYRNKILLQLVAWHNWME